MDDEYIVNLHKEVQFDLFNWKKVAYLGEILHKSKTRMDNGEYENWIETKVFITPKYADFYEFVYQNRDMINQFTFKNTIPGNLPEMREILVKAGADFESGKLDKLQFVRLSNVSDRIIDYINWIIQDRGL
jgi:hypothetical protein